MPLVYSNPVAGDSQSALLIKLESGSGLVQIILTVVAKVGQRRKGRW